MLLFLCLHPSLLSISSFVCCLLSVCPSVRTSVSLCLSRLSLPLLSFFLFLCVFPLNFYISFDSCLSCSFFISFSVTLGSLLQPRCKMVTFGCHVACLGGRLQDLVLKLSDMGPSFLQPHPPTAENTLPKNTLSGLGVLLKEGEGYEIPAAEGFEKNTHPPLPRKMPSGQERGDYEIPPPLKNALWPRRGRGHSWGEGGGFKISPQTRERQKRTNFFAQTF